MGRIMLGIVLTVLGTVGDGVADVGRPMPSLREQYLTADSAVIVEWESARKTSMNSRTAYKIVQVLRDGPEESVALVPGGRLIVNGYIDAQPGSRFLLLGEAQKLKYELKYKKPIEGSADLFEYLESQPPEDASTEVKLKFLIPYLESRNTELAKDAHRVLQTIPWDEIAAHRDCLPLADIRHRLADPHTEPVHLRSYARLITLIGNKDDVPVLKTLVHRPSNGFRVDAEAACIGYLMLGGETALADLEQTRLHVPGTPFIEVYAGLQALRYVWEHGQELISQDRLRQSMRGLLLRPDSFDLVVLDLAQWQDWSIADQLIDLYGKSGYDLPMNRRAIVVYFLKAAAAKPDDPRIAKHLATLRERSPKLLKDIEDRLLTSGSRGQ